MMLYTSYKHVEAYDPHENINVCLRKNLEPDKRVFYFNSSLVGIVSSCCTVAKYKLKSPESLKLCIWHFEPKTWSNELCAGLKALSL